MKKDLVIRFILDNLKHQPAQPFTNVLLLQKLITGGNQVDHNDFNSYLTELSSHGFIQLTQQSSSIMGGGAQGTQYYLSVDILPFGIKMLNEHGNYETYLKKRKQEIFWGNVNVKGAFITAIISAIVSLIALGWTIYSEASDKDVTEIDGKINTAKSQMLLKLDSFKSEIQRSQHPKQLDTTITSDSLAIKKGKVK